MIRLLSSLGTIQVAILAVNLVRAKYLSVALGPAGFGVVATIDQLVLSAVHLAGLGLPFTSLKFLSRSHSVGPEAFRASYATFLRAMSTLALAALGAMLLVLLARPEAFGAGLVPYQRYVLVAVLTLPMWMLNVFFVNALASAGKSIQSAIVNFLFTGALALGACVGVALGGIGGLYAFTATCGGVATVGTLLYLRSSARLHLRHPSAGVVQELKRSPEIVTYSLMLYVALSAYSLAMLFTRYVVLSEAGEVEAGLLQAVLSISLAMGAVLGAMNSLYLTPLVNRNLPPAEKLAHAHEFLVRVALLLTLAGLPALLFPGTVLTILFSSDFIGAASVLYLFVLWQSLYQLVNAYQQVLIGLDDVAFYAVTTTLGFLMAAGLCPVLVPRFGLAGAGWALTAGIGFNGITAAFRLHLTHGAGIPARSWTAMALCCGNIVAAGYLFGGPEEWSVASVAPRVLYAVVVAAATWGAVPPADRRDLAYVAGRLLRR